MGGSDERGEKRRFTTETQRNRETERKISDDVLACLGRWGKRERGRAGMVVRREVLAGWKKKQIPRFTRDDNVVRMFALGQCCEPFAAVKVVGG